MPSGEWPTVGKLRGRLDRIAPGLKAAGIEVSSRMDNHAKVWRMRISTTPGFESVAPLPSRLVGDGLPG